MCAHVCRGQRTGSWALLQETFELFVWDSLIGVELHCVSRLVSELRGSACVCLSSSLCRDHKPVSAYHLPLSGSQACAPPHLPLYAGSEHEIWVLILTRQSFTD